MQVLVINCGSSSLKAMLIDSDNGHVHYKTRIERIGQELTHAEAIEQLLRAAESHQLDAVGHRVVHGGDRFRDAVLIDDSVIDAIRDWIPQAPLHNPNNLAGIEAAREAWPSVPQVAVFDTAFHATLPRRAHSYAIDTEIAAAHRLRRFGFHGTSHACVAGRAAQHLHRPLADLRIVSLHLGNGASACAVEFGHSTETSMGMTPLEGLVMGTRCGDIDPGLLLMLQRELGLGLEELDQMLNRESGLKGLSGVSNDLREIEAAAVSGHDRARLAMAVFAHRARKYVGAYAATMGGIDALVLTGGIGQNSASMRERICQRLGFLGLLIDEDLNRDARVDAQQQVVDISQAHARVRTLVVQTDEELMIAQQAARIAAGDAVVPDAEPIPIAISARHIHLTTESFALLFGAEAEPTPYKDLSQPGQYACHERVNLIGPRGRIDGVRVLGPLRSKNQVEISRTDEFRLGVDAPVRNSGQTEDSAPIVLEGPAGRLALDQGLICARRHIHMHPDDAKRYGVKHRDEVEVAITGGPRDLIFGDVTIRVSPKYRLEMHIDTDEANAAELSSRSGGDLVYTGINDAAAQIRSRRPEP